MRNKGMEITRIEITHTTAQILEVHAMGRSQMQVWNGGSPMGNVGRMSPSTILGVEKGWKDEDGNNTNDTDEPFLLVGVYLFLLL